MPHRHARRAADDEAEFHVRSFSFVMGALGAPEFSVVPAIARADREIHFDPVEGGGHEAADESGDHAAAATMVVAVVVMAVVVVVAVVTVMVIVAVVTVQSPLLVGGGRDARADRAVRTAVVIGVREGDSEGLAELALSGGQGLLLLGGGLLPLLQGGRDGILSITVGLEGLLRNLIAHMDPPPQRVHQHLMGRHTRTSILF